ncbi:Rap1 GTPase-GDP dissociation stimulator 1 [Coemansia sp. RSA 1813]|nr:Rap1 GTPase-GDP dissociation stimulator 1 [Coemansia sp. RSA 1646]KAJ1771996.1 Rap1 GTPase-GDP dissociation stimulator 1 [Coemansia sp. RSA 1843]KAJ2089768.1 Rap1 GTPase-GDP dissociation stimulator 1 [Coemansia sp. RSA 986]KAJ2210517.1 Rap1 GTPase-GDP dissociation stimulator 1 [Coemansia sp. RSA 487]KAJ2569645.1 Rap1 GTPase-GDP dissociation stimulator 1 [Coemansia sp. RSA 1813]
MAIPTWTRRLAATNSEQAPTGAWLTEHEATNGESVESLDPVLHYLDDKQEEAVSGAQIITTAKVFKALADVCRAPEARQKITETTELAHTACLMLGRVYSDLTSEQYEEERRAEQVFLLVQVLRCICNLAADNDAARHQILDAGGIELLAGVLCSVDEVRKQPLPVGQAAFGATLNVSLDNKECTGALVSSGALHVHLKTFTSDTGLPIWPLVSSSLDNLCEHDSAAQQFEAHSDYARGVLRSLARLARTLSDTSVNADDAVVLRGAQRTLLWILCEVLEKSATVRKQLCTPEAVLSLFDILEFYLLSNSKELDDDGEDEEEEKEDDREEAVSQPPNKPLPQAANRYADAVTQAIIGISGEDEALDILFTNPQLIARLLSILSTDRTNDSQSSRAQRLDAMAAAAALCLGNLARSDEHCTRLVTEHPALVRTLIHEWFASRDTNVRTRHAASGLLKNLCLPAANKPTMVSFGLVRVAALCIDTAVIPIQANAIGILRHLINSHGDNSTTMQTTLGLLEEHPTAGGKKIRALDELLKVVRSTDIDGIRCEGTRLVAAVAKRIYLPTGANKNDPALVKAQGLLEEKSFDIVSPLVRLVMLDGQRHPLLQQESLVALTVLASSDCLRARHITDIVRHLAAPADLPAAKPEEANEDDKEAEDAPKTFGQALDRILRQEGAVWPQTTLQAKSLVSHLCAIVNTSSSDIFELKGLDFLQTVLAPNAK